MGCELERSFFPCVAWRWPRALFLLSNLEFLRGCASCISFQYFHSKPRDPGSLLRASKPGLHPLRVPLAPRTSHHVGLPAPTKASSAAKRCRSCRQPWRKIPLFLSSRENRGVSYFSPSTDHHRDPPPSRAAVTTTLRRTTTASNHRVFGSQCGLQPHSHDHHLVNSPYSHITLCFITHSFYIEVGISQFFHVFNFKLLFSSLNKTWFVSWICSDVDRERRNQRSLSRFDLLVLFGTGERWFPIEGSYSTYCCLDGGETVDC